MQKDKWILSIITMTILGMTLLMGCGNRTNTISIDLSALQTDISTLTVSENVQVVGLGEASHGVKEYHQMKAEVFKALVANNGCRTFIIEGDFGGALKVDDYIHGGRELLKMLLEKLVLRFIAHRRWLI